MPDLSLRDLLNRLRIRPRDDDAEAEAAAGAPSPDTGLEVPLLLPLGPGPVDPVPSAAVTLASERARDAASGDLASRDFDAAGLAGRVLDAGGRRAIVIDATARDGDGAGLLAALQALGLESGASFGAVASGLLPIDAIGRLSGIENLLFARESVASSRSVRLSSAPRGGPLDGDGALAALSQGRVVSQGDRAMGTGTARTAYGVDGSGITVGVISNSFNRLDGQADDVASNDLPAGTRVLQEGLSDGNDEGRALAQIVHDIAPGANILFATGDYGIANFARNIIALADAGARVIVDDVSYANETAYQDGPIAQAVAQVVARGVTYVSSAGNNSNDAYAAPFNPAATQTTLGNQAVTLHQFAPGQTSIPITIGANGGRDVNFVLQWDNPAASVSPGRGATADLDVFLLSSSGAYIRTLASTSNTGGDPIETFAITGASSSTLNYRIAVGLRSGSAPADFRLISRGNGLPVTFGDVASNRSSSTVYGHSTARDTISVGAVNYRQTPAYGPSPPVLENFSSLGYGRVTWDQAGNRLATAETRYGPTIAAPDGGDTTFFGGSDTDGNGRPNFFGTSAAAPHAAGLAALMLQANPALTPADIRNLMRDSAADMDNPYTAGFDTGYDAATGAGLVQGGAVNFAATGVITNVQRNPVLLGTHLADTFIGGAGVQTFAGAGGGDVYRGTAAELNGDVITDFTDPDTIRVTDAAALYDVRLVGNRLSFALTPGGATSALTLSGAFEGSLRQRGAPGGGVDLYFLPATQVAEDLTRDGQADLVLQNGPGIIDWVIGGGRYQGANALTSTAVGYTVVGTGDVNRDGTSDILLQNGGTVVDWIMGNGRFQAGNTISTGAAGYTVRAVGDFDGDGTADVALQSGSTVVTWTLQNGRYESGRVLGQAGAGFTVVGAGDFNGDGTDDLLLQNGGTVTEWLLRNGGYESGRQIAAGAAGYAVVGIGDFNGDRTDDILLQGGGTVVDWIMANGQYQSGNTITSAAAGFTVRATGDYNGDGTADIALQAGTGTVVQWTIRNGLYASGTVIGNGGGFSVV